ncbi:hypothetical protein FS749_007576 [Ceratobasidium sp. UAMH 11750]|nr:hypothetical protein FS749_007576 [Ceratobasidium sp. UAMH 11750]
MQTTALEGNRSALPAVAKFQHVAGVLAHKETPLLGQLRTRDGKPGFDIDWFHGDPLEKPKAERAHHTIGQTRLVGLWIICQRFIVVLLDDSL